MAVVKLKLASLVVVLFIIASGHQARSDTFLVDKTWGLVSVECFAFAGTVLQNSYGLWWMQVDGLSTLAFKAEDINTSEIDCHFVLLTTGGHQWFPVYKASGLAVACGLDCHWTIGDTGFLLHDPVANRDVQVYPWLPAPDNWSEPH